MGISICRRALLWKSYDISQDESRKRNNDLFFQWCVVGDTFPVGCDFSDACVFGKKSFANNPDTEHEEYRLVHYLHTIVSLRWKKLLGFSFNNCYSLIKIIRNALQD